jgi:hypothetical protein
LVLVPSASSVGTVCDALILTMIIESITRTPPASLPSEDVKKGLPGGVPHRERLLPL